MAEFGSNFEVSEIAEGSGVSNEVSEDVQELNDDKLDVPAEETTNENIDAAPEAETSDNLENHEDSQQVENLENVSNEPLEQPENSSEQAVEVNGKDPSFETSPAIEHTNKISEAKAMLPDTDEILVDPYIEDPFEPDETENLKQELENTKEDLANTEEKLGETEEKLSETEEKLGKNEEKLSETEEKLGETEEKLGKTEEKLGETEEKLGETEEKLGETEEKLGETEEKLGKTEEELRNTKEKLGETEEKLGKLEEENKNTKENGEKPENENKEQLDPKEQAYKEMVKEFSDSLKNVLQNPGKGSDGKASGSPSSGGGGGNSSFGDIGKEVGDIFTKLFDMIMDLVKKALNMEVPEDTKKQVSGLCDQFIKKLGSSITTENVEKVFNDVKGFLPNLSNNEEKK